MSTRAIGTAALALAACAPPMEGEPCAPGSSCEAPCADIRFEGDEWVVPYYFGLPAAPQCIPDCTRAVLQDDACADTDGETMPRECCDCRGAALDDAGQCTHGAHGFALPAFCCGS